MPAPDLSAQYESRRAQLQSSLDEARSQSIFSMLLFGVALLLIPTAAFFAFRDQSSPLFVLAAAALAIFRGLRLHHHKDSEDRFWRLRRLYERALQRVNGEWAGSGPDGEDCLEPAHPYATDLNILGHGSLFQLLCTARTSIGRRGLADYLLQLPTAEEILARQAAVKELRDRVDLREAVALLGKFDFSESRHEAFDEWAAAPPFVFIKAIQYLALASSALVALLALGTLSTLIHWRVTVEVALPILGLNFAIGALYHEPVKAMISQLRHLAVEIAVLRDGVHFLETHQFDSPKLQALSAAVRDQSKALRRLERYLGALNERDKEWFYGPSLLLLTATQICMAVEQWRASHSLQSCITAWAEYEALNALATYAYENLDNAFPTLAPPQLPVYRAEALGHPLLTADSCVTNDLHLGADLRFYLVSGSNMSGKSTLLRSIGVNAVLALAGAPVRARSLLLSPLTICASLSVVDSLAEGKSRFMAEMDKLRQILDLSAAQPPVLFLIDEIFSGTNSRDRRVAAEAVVRTLIANGALGALSTHDLALAEIADIPAFHGANVHIGSRGNGDPLDFDYLLKPGVSDETNALAIARLAGVPV